MLFDKVIFNYFIVCYTVQVKYKTSEINSTNANDKNA